MKSRADRIVRDIWILYWLFKVLSRCLHKRWYVFRDAPDLIVKMVSAVDDPPSNLEYVVKEAKKERSLRLIKIKNKRVNRGTA